METVPVSIVVSPADQTIAFGTNLQFIATGIYPDNSSQDLTIFVFWNSLSPLVATISNTANSNGLAAALATNGTTTITATLSGVTGSTTLTVSPVTLTSIDVTPMNPSVTVGSTLQFTATGHYSNGTTADLTLSTSMSWSSSNTAIATIANKKGLATGMSPGAVTITALSSGVTGTTTLTVN